MKKLLPTLLLSLVLVIGCTVGKGTGLFPPDADLTAEPPASLADDGRDHQILIANGLGETITKVERVNGVWNVTGNVLQTGQSPNQIVYHDGLCYLTNSLSNSIQVFDPETFETVREISTGTVTNPLEAAYYKGNIWLVTCHLSNEVLVMDLGEAPAGERIFERIELPSGDDLPHDEGIETYARPGGIAIVGDYAYIACANLDVFSTAGGQGLVVKIDLKSFEIVNAIEMSGRNTTQVLHSGRFPDRLLVMSAGDYTGGKEGYVGNGKVESIDLETDEIFQVVAVNGAPLAGATGLDDVLILENAKVGTVLRVDLYNGVELPGFVLPDYGERFSFASSIVSLPGLLLVTNFNTDRLHVLDPSNGEMLAELATGDGPDAMVCLY